MSNRFPLRRRTSCATLLVAGFALANVAGAAGLSQVRQTVFGMDCAPCAHGLEKGLSQLGGIEHVSVSLNDGYALVELAPDNNVTLEQIRTIIRENGFTPKDATVHVTGTLERNDDRLVLGTGAGRAFTLIASPDAADAWRELQALPDDADVTVDGIVGPADASRVSVLAVSPAHRGVSGADRTQR